MPIFRAFPQQRFVADRSTEYAAWLASGTAPQYDALRAFLAQEKEALAKVERLRKGRETDDFLFAKLKLRAHDGNHSEVAEILSSPANCFAGFGGTAGTSRASAMKEFNKEVWPGLKRDPEVRNWNTYPAAFKEYRLARAKDWVAVAKAKLEAELAIAQC